MDLLSNYLPFFIPYIALQLMLTILALAHVLRHPQYRFGNQFMWILIVLFLQLIGPIAYFAFGRGREE